MSGLIMRSRKKSKSFWKQMKNKHKTVQNLWDTVKAVLRRKFIAIQAYLRKTETFKINNHPMPTRTRRITTKTAQSK